MQRENKSDDWVKLVLRRFRAQVGLRVLSMSAFLRRNQLQVASKPTTKAPHGYYNLDF